LAIFRDRFRGDPELRNFFEKRLWQSYGVNRKTLLAGETPNQHNAIRLSFGDAVCAVATYNLAGDPRTNPSTSVFLGPGPPGGTSGAMQQCARYGTGVAFSIPPQHFKTQPLVILKRANGFGFIALHSAVGFGLFALFTGSRGLS
jgi:hypothetical protein